MVRRLIHRNSESELVISASKEEWVLSTAGWISGLIQSSINNHGRCTLALSGGRTPRAIYKQLASPPFIETIQWERLFVFWGDERAVGPDHPDSNYRMGRETLFDRVPIPEKNIFRIKGELPPEIAVERYQAELSTFFNTGSGDPPIFDLILLGLNVDGHIASLFPHTDLVNESSTNWVASTYAPRLNSWRITLTPHTLNQAHHIAFLVFGKKKAEILQQVFEGPHDPSRYPAQLVDPENGKVFWLIDEAAAKLLSDENGSLFTQTGEEETFHQYGGHHDSRR